MASEHKPIVAEDLPDLIAGAKVATADERLDQFMQDVFGPEPVDEQPS